MSIDEIIRQARVDNPEEGAAELLPGSTRGIYKTLASAKTGTRYLHIKPPVMPIHWYFSEGKGTTGDLIQK